MFILSLRTFEKAKRWRLGLKENRPGGRSRKQGLLFLSSSFFFSLLSLLLLLLLLSLIEQEDAGQTTRVNGRSFRRWTAVSHMLIIRHPLLLLTYYFTAFPIGPTTLDPLLEHIQLRTTLSEGVFGKIRSG